MSCPKRKNPLWKSDVSHEELATPRLDAMTAVMEFARVKMGVSVIMYLVLGERFVAHETAGACRSQPLESWQTYAVHGRFFSAKVLGILRLQYPELVVPLVVEGLLDEHCSRLESRVLW